jgi:hypothetical protein
MGLSPEESILTRQRHATKKIALLYGKQSRAALLNTSNFLLTPPKGVRGSRDFGTATLKNPRGKRSLVRILNPEIRVASLLRGFVTDQFLLLAQFRN